MMCRPDQGAVPSGRWQWLFPASYAVHIAEEGLAGERFYRWIHRVVGREIGPHAFPCAESCLRDRGGRGPSGVPEAAPTPDG
jgi:hypothetical protein